MNEPGPGPINHFQFSMTLDLATPKILKGNIRQKLWHSTIQGNCALEFLFVWGPDPSRFVTNLSSTQYPKQGTLLGKDRGRAQGYR